MNVVNVYVSYQPKFKTKQSHLKVRMIQSDAVKKWFGGMNARKITFEKVGVSKLHTFSCDNSKAN